MLKMAQNPMAEMQRMFSNDPVYSRFQQMIQGKTPQEIEATVRNLAQTRGINIDQFRQQIGL